MEQRISLITLGVADLRRARSFYEQLGWRGHEMEETVFFQAGGQAVILWSREKLAADAGIDDDGTSTFAGIALAHDRLGCRDGMSATTDSHNRCTR